MKGICCSLPIELVGVNKFQILSKKNKSAFISLEYRDSKIYWCIIENEKPICISFSEIEDIKTSDDYSNLIVIGYKAEEIATKIKAKKFIEKDQVSTQDFLDYSRGIGEAEKFLPKPLYVSPSQSLFAKYTGPKILDKPLDVS